MKQLIKLDISEDNCPITFVKTKLFMENLNKGEKAEIILKNGEPLENIPRSLTETGYKVINIENIKDEIYKIIVEK
jgi:tRNA 2-thiouridine synthesizing protein A